MPEKQTSQISTELRSALELVHANLGLLQFKDLPQQDVEFLLPIADALTAWSKNLKDGAFTEAYDNGVKYEDYKLIHSKGNRMFTDEKKVIEILLGQGYTQDQLYIQKLKTLTQLESFLGKPQFNSLLGELVGQTAGKYYLVESTDSRPEYIVKK